MEEKKALEGPAPTKKAQLFMRLLLSGKSTVDAHKLAGYKGDPHAAYELRARFKDALALEADRMGINLEGLKTAAAALNELPVEQTSVSVREKLAIMAETRKIVELGSGSKGRVVNALIIERPPKGAIVETTIVTQPEEKSLGREYDIAVGEVGQANGEQELPPAGEIEYA